jgi:putative membrane protein
MNTLSTILISFVALLHYGFMFLEMFFWDKPLGRKIFGLREEFARESRSLAMNQGLYNGFLATGLIWGLLSGPAGIPIIIFFLVCIIIAGVFGAITVKRSILYIQSLPALIALLVTLSHSMSIP